jgi:NADH:ubiquinone oxidoreductase subunit B-like Fe-S oxidoreductase
MENWDDATAKEKASVYENMQVVTYTIAKSSCFLSCGYYGWRGYKVID